MIPGCPSRTIAQSWPGVRRRRVSQPSIHLPRSVNSPSRQTGRSCLSRFSLGAKNSSLAPRTAPPNRSAARSISSVKCMGAGRSLPSILLLLLIAFLFPGGLLPVVIFGFGLPFRLALAGSRTLDIGWTLRSGGPVALHIGRTLDVRRTLRSRRPVAVYIGRALDVRRTIHARGPVPLHIRGPFDIGGTVRRTGLLG